MDSLLDRLGLYDFFNVLIAGGIVLLYSIGLESCFVCMCPKIFTKSLILGALSFLIAYLLGMICQEIGRFITETYLGIKDKWVERLLDEKKEEWEYPNKKIKEIKRFIQCKTPVIKNACKVSVYKKYVKEILSKVEKQEEISDKEKLRYAFAYCIYYIQCRGQNQKVEKMRAHYGMAQNLVGAGLMIIVSGTVILLCLGQCPNVEIIIGSIMLAITLMLLGLVRVYVYSIRMIRMTMGVYEACIENK